MTFDSIQSVADAVVVNAKTDQWLNRTFRVAHPGAVDGYCIVDDIPEQRTLKSLRAEVESFLGGMLNTTSNRLTP